MSDNLKIEYARAALMVNTSHVAGNIQAVRKLVNSHTMIMAVVKANGYGHGALDISKAALCAGADWLGVATVQEGLALRTAGISSPILVLSPVFTEEFDDLLQGGLTSTFFALEACKKLSEAATRLGKTAAIHIKIDTGMNRVGYNSLNTETIVSEVLAIRALPNIEINGMYSHFAASDSNAAFTTEQFSRFMNVLKKLEQAGVHIPIKHISNSGGIINHPECNLDMVRCGVLVYGLAPCSTPEGAAQLANIGILPVLTLKSRVAHVKTVKNGESVGYSRNYNAKDDITVATIPIGYADGISRQLSNKGKVIINGKVCNIIGNICMDQLMVDVTGADAKLRDEVTFIGQDGSYSISTEDIATMQGSINYEVATSMSLRIPTYYK